MLNDLKFCLSLYFPIRYYLKKDIKDVARRHDFSGSVLDFGCGSKPFSNLFQKSKYEGIDFKNYSANTNFPQGKPDYFFDDKYLENFLMPFVSGHFDHSVSFQVLEHHPEPEIMISEMARIIKKNGKILLSFPLIYSLHEEPNDFQRFTEHKIRKILTKNGCEVIEIKKQGALWSACAMLLNEQLNHFAAKSKINYAFSSIAYIPLLFFQYLCLLLDRVIRTEITFINYMVLAQKTRV